MNFSLDQIPWNCPPSFLPLFHPLPLWHWDTVHSLGPYRNILPNKLPATAGMQGIADVLSFSHPLLVANSSFLRHMGFFLVLMNLILSWGFRWGLAALVVGRKLEMDALVDPFGLNIYYIARDYIQGPQTVPSSILFTCAFFNLHLVPFQFQKPTVS